MTGWIIWMTLINMVVIGLNGWVTYRKLKHTNWRFWLPRLNVPLIGFAASYGVFGFNNLFLPFWVSIVQASSLESTYVGMAAMDTLNHAQQKTAKKISMWAGWLSFCQNLLAGLFYARPAIMTWLRGDGVGQLFGWFVLSAMHASQIWIAYHTATLVFHHADNPGANNPLLPPQKGSSKNVTVRVLRNRPASMRKQLTAPKLAQFPQPKRVAIGTPDKKNNAYADDPRAELVRRMRDEEGLKYQEIALRMGIKNRQTVQSLYKYGKTYVPKKKQPTE